MTREAWDGAFARVCEIARRIGMSMKVHPDNIKDLVQDVVILVYQRWETLDGGWANFVSSVAWRKSKEAQRAGGRPALLLQRFMREGPGEVKFIGGEDGDCDLDFAAHLDAFFANLSLEEYVFACAILYPEEVSRKDIRSLVPMRDSCMTRLRREVQAKLQNHFWEYRPCSWQQTPRPPKSSDPLSEPSTRAQTAFNSGERAQP